VAVALQQVEVRREGRALVAGVDWEVRAEERWVVLGPNGSGKTTLLQVAALRLLPTRGAVRVLGQVAGRCDLRRARRSVALVSAAVARQVRPSLSAAEVVLTGRTGALEPWWDRYEEADRAQARELLDRAGVGHVAEQPFGVLSEGERQQVLLARGLMASPGLLLLDEPAAGLDLGARERLLQSLAAVATSPTQPPLVLVTHHLEEIPPGITHALLIRAGRVVAAGPVETVLTGDTVSACFGLPVQVERRGDRWGAAAR
jgi:iron complex transport system ATP-binding protein